MLIVEDPGMVTPADKPEDEQTSIGEYVAMGSENCANMMYLLSPAVVHLILA